MTCLIDKRFKYNPQNGFVSQSLTDKSIKEYLDIFSTTLFTQFDNLNELLECFNILIYLKETNDNKFIIDNGELRALEQHFKSAVGWYFNNIKSEDELKEIIKSTDNQYRDDLILIFSQFSNVTKKFLTYDVIIFLCENSYLQFILDDRKFLNQHSLVLKSYLFSHIESFPLYLSKDLVNSNPPFNFTSEEFNSLVDKYRCIPKEKKYESLVQILKNRLLSKIGRYHVSNLKDELAKDFHTYVNYDIEVKFITSRRSFKF